MVSMVSVCSGETRIYFTQSVEQTMVLALIQFTCDPLFIFNLDNRWRRHDNLG